MNLWRNKYLSLASMALIALIIFIFNIIIFVHEISNNAIENFNDKVDIIIYIKDGSDFVEVDNLIEELRGFKDIKDLKFTSKEQALNNLLDTFPEQENPFEKYGIENKLPANIQIITNTPKSHPQIISFLYEGQYSHLLKEVENNKENQKLAQKLANITDASKKIIMGIIIAFLIGGFLIIINGVYLTIYSRKEEINIMKLVGASYFYIKSPFILEGLIYGSVGAIINILLVLIFVKNFQINEVGLNIQNYNYILLFLFEILAGAILGFLASLIAVEKYLNE